MKRRYLFTLAALLLFLSACSSDNDLVSQPNLEPQFGMAADDIGFDVAVTSTGSVAVLSREQSYEYYEGSDSYALTHNLLWRLYNKNGSLASTNTLDRDECIHEDGLGYPCYLSTPETIIADTAGNSYALYTKPHSSQYVDHEEVLIDYYMRKYNSSGGLVRSFSLGGTYDTRYNPGFPDVSVDANGNIYFVARWGVEGNIREVIKKYDANNGFLWYQDLPTGISYGITVNSTGYIYVVGSRGMARYSNTGTLAWFKTGALYSGSDQTEVVASGTNIYVSVPKTKTIRKYDGAGRLLWSKIQSGLNTLVIGDINADQNGNVYITGKYRPTSSSPANVFVRKLRPSGTILWTKIFGTPQYDDGRGIATINGSEIYVTGETQGSLAHANRGGKDGYLRKLNSLGNPVWTR